MGKILIVEDDADLASYLKALLEGDQHFASAVHDGADALDLLRHYHFDLVILDWILPGLHGIDVCKQLRLRGDNLPILMLSSKGEVAHKATALFCGADDYQVKPIHPRELLARVRALMRRTPQMQSAQLKMGNANLDMNTLTLTRGCCKIVLQPKEAELLCLFIKSPNQLISAQRIAAVIGSAVQPASSDAIKVYVNKLRSKFKQLDLGWSIISAYGRGYTFAVPTDVALVCETR